MDAVVAALRREQIQVTRIQPARPRRARRRRRGSSRRKSVPAKNLAVFTRQFSVMIDAGLPLVQCLDILGNQEEHKYFAQVILQTRTDVEGGMSLAEAMKRHPKVFDALFCNMIAAGEAGGILDTILKRLAIYIEKAVKLKGQVKSAMIYPIAVIVHRRRRHRRDPVEGHSDLRLAVCGPRRRAAAADARRHRAQRQPDPLHAVPDHRLLRASAGRFRTYYATEKGRRVIDAITLKMPILGPILRKIAVARFCRTLSTLMASGVPILDGLDITAKTSGNAIIEDAIMTTRKSIERGETIAAPLKETGVFPGMVVQMIGVGEATGALDTMLGKIADFYEEEVDVAVEGLLTLLEPVMIAFLGGAVGGIVIAMYMPIFDLISKLT